MAVKRAMWLALLGLTFGTEARSHGPERLEVPGHLIGVSVEIDGRPVPLFPAPDGSGRHYLEARQGRRYAVSLVNRTAARLGVVLTVDGLNVISGQRDEGQGRMYVLEPWQRTTVRGWRTSLEEVRRFTFVDEARSYAARSGKANAKLGWIEASVYGERRPWVREGIRREAPVPLPRPSEPEAHDASRAPAAPPPGEGSEAESPSEPASTVEGRAGARSFPGTGWGRRVHDRVVLVDFEPEASPAERTTLRYEYRQALVALGVLPHARLDRDRLWQRDRGEDGFAPAPLW
jgi:hypothetical protein